MYDELFCADGADQNEISNKISEQELDIKKMENDFYNKYGCGVDRITKEMCGEYRNNVLESSSYRDLWHSFDCANEILTVNHPVVSEMLEYPPKWFVHMKLPKPGERHKRNVLKKIYIESINTQTTDLFFYKWLCEPNQKRYIPHLYNVLTGISCCGKAKANTTQLNMFEIYENKCKLCIRSERKKTNAGEY